MNDRDRRRLAQLLRQNAQVVSAALRSKATDANLGQLAACLTLTELADQSMRQLVSDCRGAGATWADIGGVLRTSRQAAHQRFKEMEAVDVETMRLQERALTVVARWRDGEGALIVADFDDTMRERLNVEELAKAWGQVSQMMGELLSSGTPTTTSRGPYRVVDVPLNFRQGPMKGRVVFDREKRIAGLFLLLPDVP